MEHVREALRQVIEGDDFDSPSKLLKNIKPAQAAALLHGAPYSIATNVGHTDHWNEIWLARLTGEKAPAAFPDFPIVTGEEWPAVRESFLANLSFAYEIACRVPFEHKSKSDEAAQRRLLKIAVHTAYHLGQVKLLKRMLKSAPTIGQDL